MSEITPTVAASSVPGSGSSKEITLSDLEKVQISLNNSISTLESGIYGLEKKYLEATINSGNVASGWEGYAESKPRTYNPNPPSYKRDRKGRTKEKIFSGSSLTSEANNLSRTDEHKHPISGVQDPFGSTGLLSASALEELRAKNKKKKKQKKG